MAESIAPPLTSASAKADEPRADASRWLRRLRLDSMATFIVALVMLLVILLNAASLVFYTLFREDVAVAAAAGQAADQLIAIRRLVERAAPPDRALIIRRLNSPAMVMAVTRRPIVTHSDDQFTSRVVLRRLMRDYPEGTEIYVDSRIERESPAGDGFPSNEEVERQMRDDDDRAAADSRMPPDHRIEAHPGMPPPPLELMTREERRARRLENIIRSPSPYTVGGPEAIIRASIKVGEGAWFNSRIVLAVTDNPSRNQPVVFLSALSLLIALVALWGVRRATRPLALFASAAERLGVDVNADPLPVAGPGEVRRAARAFNTMQTRIKRFIQDRTQMLAAISHDLRTPITRMKLRAEFVDDDEQRAKMLHDLDEMERMIAATLAFARDDAANEPTADVDVAALLANMAADARAGGRDVTYSGPAQCDFVTRPLALKRAIGNLVDNALKYGKRARVMLTPLADGIEIVVEDDGPGIPASDRERVFAPFFRLEGSRSRETGGTGLGLTITRNAVRSMGGDIELANRVENGTDAGLRARVMLPRTQDGTA